MQIDDLQRHWDALGRQDPLWAILTARERKNGRWTEQEFFETGRREIAELFSEIDQLRIDRSGWKRALDFGCGVGRLSQALVGFITNVTGVDIAPSMVETARKLNRAGDRCKYVVNGRADLNIFEAGSFDLIYSNIVLQHMRPELSHSYIAEFVRLLAPGGLAVFQLPTTPKLTPVGIGLRVLPISVIRIIRKMDMYGTSANEVARIVEQASGRIVMRRADPGTHWHGYRYMVTRLATS